MLSENAKAFGELSKNKVKDNLTFVSKMQLHGEKIQINCRSGLRDAIIHRSSSRTLVPTIFEIYGGCFSQGYVANNDKMRSAMQESTNYNVIGLDYRKSPDFPYPCGLEDVFDGIKYFYTRATKFNIDTKRIAVWGHSAGANLAFASTMLIIEEKLFSPKAMLLDYPYLDAYTPGIEKTKKTTGLTADVLDAMNEIYADEKLRRTKYISPVFIPQNGLVSLPPSVFVICGKDPLKAEAMTMVDKLMRAGIPIVSRLFPEASHGFLEHWFFKEFYLDSLSSAELAGVSPNIEELAKEGLQFVIKSAKFLLE